MTTYHYDPLKGHIVVGPEIRGSEVYHREWHLKMWGNLFGTNNWHCEEFQIVKNTNLDQMIEKYNMKRDKHSATGRIRGPYIHNVCNHPSTNLNQR